MLMQLGICCSTTVFPKLHSDAKSGYTVGLGCKMKAVCEFGGLQPFMSTVDGSVDEVCVACVSQTLTCQLQTEHKLARLSPASASDKRATT